MYKILKNTIEMDDYSVQKLSNQPPEPFEWNTVEGIELNVSDCIGGKGKIEVKGNTYQKQLKGYNLLNLEKYGYDENNSILNGGSVLIEDGNILLNGNNASATMTAKSVNMRGENRDILPAGTYYFGVRTNGHYVDGETETSAQIGTGIKTLDYPYKITQWFIPCSAGSTVIAPLIISKDSTKTDYEPYCGGASPNPDYPQDIKVVTGDNVVKHVGKNFWGNLTSYSVRSNGIDFVQNNDGTVIANGTSTGYAVSVTVSNALQRNIYKTLSAGTYSVSGGKSSKKFVSVYNKDATLIGRDTGAGFTFTLTEDTIIILRVEITSEETAVNEIFYIQLEEGSTPTPYEPYREEEYELSLGTMELCKIGDYEDIQFKNEVEDENYNAELEDGAWYKKSAIAEVVLDGRETWNYNSGNRYFFTNKFLDNYVTQYTKLVSNNYIGGMASNGGLYNNHIQTGTAYSFMLCDNRFTDKNDLKTWLSTHNTIVKYPLATPTYEKITDPTLISQLEALRKAKWFKGVNHWWTETNNLEPVLKGTYRQAINE